MWEKIFVIYVIMKDCTEYRKNFYRPIINVGTQLKNQP